MKNQRLNSQQWLLHFKSNLNQNRIDWDLKTTITEEQKALIIRSLQAWQLGETSEGNQLRQAAQKYAILIDDMDYLEAIDLFIKEEQKHGENLGKYLDAIGEKRLGYDFGDYLFRKIRHINLDIEIWTITVIIVESFAQIYYKAIADATACPLLKSICQDILKDEAHHIRFQKERLLQIIDNQSITSKIIRNIAYTCLFYGITSAVWIGHSKAFKAGNVNFWSYLRRAEHKFKKIREYIFSKKDTYPFTISLLLKFSNQ
jgi:hypothetical protein